MSKSVKEARKRPSHSLFPTKIRLQLVPRAVDSRSLPREEPGSASGCLVLECTPRLESEWDGFPTDGSKTFRFTVCALPAKLRSLENRK